LVADLRSCEGNVVGVVGLGHLDGIEKIWKVGNLPLPIDVLSDKIDNYRKKLMKEEGDED